jgi:predicted nucleic-acid-binding protein
VVIHGTFILGLPVETQQTIENTINFAKELDVFSLQVSLAAPYPGTELYEMAKQNGWFAKKDKTDLVEADGLQQSTLEYPGLNKDKIFEEVDRFYRTYYLRPKPILRIIKTMLEDKDILVRRCREGYEFFRSLRERKADLAASKAWSPGQLENEMKRKAWLTFPASLELVFETPPDQLWQKILKSKGGWKNKLLSQMPDDLSLN